jgi:hypothetical protein
MESMQALLLKTNLKLPQQTFANLNTNHPEPVEALTPMDFSKEQAEMVMGDFAYFGLAR